MMQRKTLMMGVLGVVVLGALGFGSRGVFDDSPKLDERYAVLAPLVGHAYEIDGAWADGSPIWARNEYRVGLNGQFVESKVIAINEDGEKYQRYLTVMSIDKETGEFTSYGFTYDGTARAITNEIRESDDGDPVLFAEWNTSMPTGEMTIRQEVELKGDRYLWRVWARPAGSEASWNQMMDGAWIRKERLQ